MILELFRNYWWLLLFVVVLLLVYGWIAYRYRQARRVFVSRMLDARDARLDAAYGVVPEDER